MTSRAASVARRCPGLDEACLARWLDRVPGDYLERFDDDDVARHAQALASLESDKPLRVVVSDLGDRAAAVTVVGYDRPFVFSLIAGVLFGEGLDVARGDVFSVPQARPESEPDKHGRRPRRRFGVQPADPGGAASGSTSRGSTGLATRAASAASTSSPLDAAVIVDRIEGSRVDPGPFDAWARRLEAAFDRVAERLADDDRDAEQARREVNARVVARLEATTDEQAGRLLPMDIRFEAVDAPVTRVAIRGQDSPAFLYALSTALSVHRLDIQRVRIREDAEGVSDEIDLVDRRTRKPLDDHAQQRVRLAALLTKQFTYFLGRAPDPMRAIERFGRLIEDLLDQPATSLEGQSLSWVDLVGNPRAMRELSRLLGASDYIWEDFIRGQYETLIPLIHARGESPAYAAPPETLPLKLEQFLDGAVGLSEQRDRLNRFKDREVYRIDLDHILAPAGSGAAGSSFTEFSRRLTALAELLVATATRLVYDDLVRSYGKPTLHAGKVARHAVFGLGKLGGVALGYASDIELLYMYESGGKTTGGKRKAISNAEFFETLAREGSQFIQAKREGIFEVDLRLRPYGKNSPLAVSVESFRRYYLDGEPGRDAPPAHSFERLALVRLRWIAGDAELGYRVERLRDEAVYDRHDAIDLEALWDLLRRNRKEKNKDAAGRFNAKHGVGGLADLEGAVQLLQVTHARRAPQLRTPRVSRAIDSLHRAGVVTAQEYADLAGAYRFFRELINALRVLRGNARDLFLPLPDAEEATHLARRMQYRATESRPATAALDADLEAHASKVSAFFESHFDRQPPGA